MDIKQMVNKSLVGKGYDREKIVAKNAMIVEHFDGVYTVSDNTPANPAVGDYYISHSIDTAKLYVLVLNDIHQTNEWVLLTGDERTVFPLLKPEYRYNAYGYRELMPAYVAIYTVVTDIKHTLWEVRN